MLSQLAGDRGHHLNLTSPSGAGQVLRVRENRVHEVMLVGQVLIGGFWNLVNYGIRSRGKRQQKEFQSGRV